MMGDVADMMLDGTLCEGCGVYLGEAVDYPRRCKRCQKDQRVDALRTATHTHHREQKIPCPTCGKRVKIVGLTDHMRDSHGVRPNVEVRRGDQATPQSADIKTVASTAGLAPSQQLKD